MLVKNYQSRPPVRTARPSERHPSLGGSRGYSQDIRLSAQEVRNAGNENDPVFVQLRLAHNWPSKTTTWRHSRRQQDEGHFRPYRMTGGKPPTVLRGKKLVLLAFFRRAYPKATAAEINAFLFNTTPPGEEQRFYSPSQITEAENRLCISRKRGSTMARQMETRTNLAKRHQFWNLPPPFGVRGLTRALMIDWDEAAIFVETTDRGYGKCFVGKECLESGPYGHSKKFTLTVAIKGGPGGRRWIRWSEEAGTDVGDVIEFLEEIIDEIGDGNQLQNRHTFLADNLSSHKHDTVWQLIQGHGHRYIPRAPYAARDGPSELIFNVIEQELTQKIHDENIDTPEGLEKAVRDIIGGLTTFDPYFGGLGYAP